MTGSSRRKAGLRRGRLAVAGAFAATAVMAFGASSAQAATPFNATFDDAALNVGVTFDILDPPKTATMNSTDWDKGGANTFTVSPANFVFPDFSGDALPGVPVTVAFSALSTISGNLNPTTGAMTTTASPYRAVVSLSGAVCTYDVNMAFDTLSASPFNGDPFTVVAGPPDTLNDGDIETHWAGLPPANPHTGDCSLIDSLVSGAGGIAMGRGIDLTPATSTAAPPVATPPAAATKKCKKAKKGSAQSAKKKKKGCKKKKKK